MRACVCVCVRACWWLARLVVFVHLNCDIISGLTAGGPPCDHCRGHEGGGGGWGTNNQKREGVHRRSLDQDKITVTTAQTTGNERACTTEAHLLAISVKSKLRNTGFIKKQNKKRKTAFRTCPRIQKTGNLVDKVVLPLVGVFFHPGGPENGLAGPAFIREKSILILFNSRISEFPNFRISEFPNFPISKFPNFPISQFSNIRMYKSLNFRIPGFSNNLFLKSHMLELQMCNGNASAHRSAELD